MSTIEVKVPDIGDFKDIPVIEVLVKAGDSVKAEDSLVTLESDKATMDVPSPAAGKVAALKVKVGDKVSEGSVILTLETDAQASPSPQPSPASGRGSTVSAGQSASAAPAPSPQPSPAGAIGSREAAGEGGSPAANQRHQRRPRRRIPAAPTSNAKCSCWVQVRAVMRRRSAPRTSA